MSGQKSDTAINFYTVSPQGRPIRLSEETRQFAWDSLQGKYGDQTMEAPGVYMDETPGFEDMTELEKYDAAIRLIATIAPIRICKSERISGAATFGMAIGHCVPATYNGEELWYSVSHTTLGFDKAVKEGLNVTCSRIQQQLDNAADPSAIAVLTSMKNTMDSLKIWHKRYLEALMDANHAIADPGPTLLSFHMVELHNLLSKVPFEPATNFHEAVQSLWFNFAFTRLCGNWSGIGRIDALLGPYLKEDLKNGTQTIESAREILASFFIKGCEWVCSNPEPGTGDAQHYQNIVLAGVDANGNEITNEVTYLVLDIIEELGISDFPITVRINDKTPQELLIKTAEVIRHGGGVVAVYNEPLILKSLQDYGYPLEEARDFANDGCWEVIIPGKTQFSYVAFDSLALLLDTLGVNAGWQHPQQEAYASMEELYAAFYKTLESKIDDLFQNMCIHYTGDKSKSDWQWHQDPVGKGTWLFPSMAPCSAVSIYVEGCIESGRSYLNGGSKYVVVSPHIGGAPDVGNSLYAIKKLIFDEKKISFPQLMEILQNNWEGHEPLRQYALNKLTYYGNDNDEADAYTARVMKDFADITAKYKGRCPVEFPPGASTFGREIEWANTRTAVPYGRRKGDILAGNSSPSPATDTEGATAIIKSYCKIDHQKQRSGTALDIKLHPSAVKGANGVQALVSLIEGFVKLGGYFMQLDIMDANTLKAAQECPEDYKTLSVRVSGWNARFVTLNEDWQNMIIQRTAQGL